MAANLYESFGGRTACRALSVAFYARVERDSVLRPLFPGSRSSAQLTSSPPSWRNCLGAQVRIHKNAGG